MDLDWVRETRWQGGRELDMPPAYLCGTCQCDMLPLVMRTISLHLPDELLEASRRYSAATKLSRVAYIRRAIERMNRQTDAALRAKRMREASAKCRKETFG